MPATSANIVRRGAIFAALVGLRAGTSAARAEEKRYRFEMADQPWGKVFDWLTQATGKPLIANMKPTGTFTFKGPPGKEYTLGEIVHIINDDLHGQKPRLHLLQRERSFTLILPDEKPPPGRTPLLTADELEGRDDVELVRVWVTLKVLNAKAMAPDLDCEVGPPGRVVVWEEGNCLMFTGTAGNLRRLVKTLQDIEDKEIKAARPRQGQPVVQTYKVPAGQAGVIAQLLKQLFKDNPDVRVAASDGSTIVVSAPPAEQAEIVNLLR